MSFILQKYQKQFVSFPQSMNSIFYDSFIVFVSVCSTRVAPTQVHLNNRTQLLGCRILVNLPENSIKHYYIFGNDLLESPKPACHENIISLKA